MGWVGCELGLRVWTGVGLGEAWGEWVLMFWLAAHGLGEAGAGGVDGQNPKRCSHSRGRLSRARTTASPGPEPRRRPYKSGEYSCSLYPVGWKQNNTNIPACLAFNLHLSYNLTIFRNCNT